jgi:hypothetical protein
VTKFVAGVAEAADVRLTVGVQQNVVTYIHFGVDGKMWTSCRCELFDFIEDYFLESCLYYKMIFNVGGDITDNIFCCGAFAENFCRNACIDLAVCLSSCNCLRS